MPKVKTNKSAKKRFKISGTGKISRLKQNRGHLLSKKPTKQKRRLAEPAEVTGADAKKVKRLLGKR